MTIIFSRSLPRKPPQATRGPKLILIFGVSAAVAARGETVPFVPPSVVLCGLTLLALAGAPFAGSAALRMTGE